MSKTTVKRHRMFLAHTYGHLYERHFSSRPGCFYCGDPADSIDHCPPLNFMEVKDQKWFKQRKIKFYTVASCSQCNRRLSNKPFLTLHERADYILRRLEKNTDEIVSWSEDEIMEMSKVFEKAIRARHRQHQQLFERVRFAQELLHRPDDFPED
jgi:ribosomal protein L34E